MQNLPKYKKLQATILGIIVPLVLAGYTAFLVTNAEAVYWGRSSTVIYHGTEAYFVSLLWFGISAFLLGHFYFRPYRVLSPSKHSIFMWSSLLFVVAGLISALVFV